MMAALLVIFSHSFMLAGGSNISEPIFWLSRGQVTAGGLAVFMFFVISGHLITQSFERSRSVRTFTVARALRIVPALAVVLLVTACVVGPGVSALPRTVYFGTLQPVRYILGNLSLFVYVDNLPGVFSSNPFPAIINGSLWTLHIEAGCYGLILTLGLLGLLNPFVTLAGLVAGLLAMAFMQQVNYPVLLATHFLAGASIYHWRPKQSGTAAMLCAAGLGVCLVAGGFLFASATAGAYLVLHLAFASEIRIPHFTGSSDLSYGTYIWAFPVQQSVVYLLGSEATWYLDAAISLPIILGLAFASWHLVEKRALGWNRRLSAGLNSKLLIRSAAATGDVVLDP